MDTNGLEIFVSILAGVALAAATGIRAFLPLLIVNIAARLGWVDLNTNFEFLGGNIALIALSVATILEIAADKIPLVDHLLDVASTFSRPVAGILGGMAMIADLPKPVAIAMALVFGVISLGTQLARAKARVASTLATGGTANPVISAAEDTASGTLSVLATIAPVIAGLLVIAFFYILWRLILRARRFRRRSRE